MGATRSHVVEVPPFPDVKQAFQFFSAYKQSVELGVSKVVSYRFFDLAAPQDRMACSYPARDAQNFSLGDVSKVHITLINGLLFDLNCYFYSSTHPAVVHSWFDRSNYHGFLVSHDPSPTLKFFTKAVRMVNCGKRFRGIIISPQIFLCGGCENAYCGASFVTYRLEKHFRSWITQDSEARVPVANGHASVCEVVADYEVASRQGRGKVLL
jgi:hypothetical protein